MKKIILILGSLLVVNFTTSYTTYDLKSGSKGKVTIVERTYAVFFNTTNEYSCDVTPQDDLKCTNIEGAYVNNPSIGANN